MGHGEELHLWEPKPPARPRQGQGRDLENGSGLWEHGQKDMRKMKGVIKKSKNDKIHQDFHCGTAPDMGSSGLHEDLGVEQSFSCWMLSGAQPTAGPF